MTEHNSCFLPTELWYYISEYGGTELAHITLNISYEIRQTILPLFTTLFDKYNNSFKLRSHVFIKNSYHGSPIAMFARSNFSYDNETHQKKEERQTVRNFSVFLVTIKRITNSIPVDPQPYFLRACLTGDHIFLEQLIFHPQVSRSDKSILWAYDSAVSRGNGKIISLLSQCIPQKKDSCYLSPYLLALAARKNMVQAVEFYYKTNFPLYPCNYEYCLRAPDVTDEMLTTLMEAIERVKVPGPHAENSLYHFTRMFAVDNDDQVLDRFFVQDTALRLQVRKLMTTAREKGYTRKWSKLSEVVTNSDNSDEKIITYCWDQIGETITKYKTKLYFDTKVKKFIKYEDDMLV